MVKNLSLWAKSPLENSFCDFSQRDYFSDFIDLGISNFISSSIQICIPLFWGIQIFANLLLIIGYQYKRIHSFSSYIQNFLNHETSRVIFQRKFTMIKCREVYFYKCHFAKPGGVIENSFFAKFEKWTIPQKICFNITSASLIIWKL